MIINQNTFKSENPKIYLVGTPIGNLSDFSLRAIEILKTVALIFCEDTRTSHTLLQKYQINTPTQSLHKFNESARLQLIAQLIENGQSVAIISDAGVPVVSDPGAKIIHLVRQEFGPLVDISAVGAGSAYLHALIVSGFLASQHYFYGFLKNKSEQAKTNELKQVFAQSLNLANLIFYESVHRVKKTVNLLSQQLTADHQVLVARELTKLNEQILIGSIQEINEFIQSDQFVEKGEFVIILSTNSLKKTSALTDLQIKEKIDALLSQGQKLKAAAQIISQDQDLSANEIYQKYLKIVKKS